MNMLEAKNLSVDFHTRRGPVHAVRGVDFQLEKGGILGITGESGCGKTTTAMAVPRLLADNADITEGSVLYNGTDLLALTEKEMQKIRWKEISVIFQGALNALNPLKSIGYQIAEPILLHEPDTTAAEAKERAEILLEEVGIPASSYSVYPHEFSGGMRQRVMMAMSLACNPNLVIADEPVTALDVMIQAQLLDLLRSFREEHGLSMLVISHDLSVLSELCDRIAVMYAGRLVEYGAADEVITCPAHPYTACLMKSYPDIYGSRTFIQGIPGSPPDLLELRPGCPFAARCKARRQECHETEPAFVEVSAGHCCACLICGT